MRAVYTALTGGYESLKEQPLALESSVPFICFTDNPNLVSKTWDVRFSEPAFPLDSVRSARSLKIIGHPDIADYDETLWIDNRVELLADPDLILDEWLKDADWTLFRHSFREKLIHEFYAVVNGGYDDPSRVYEQLMHYAELDPELLDERPLWTGMMARRHTADVGAAMRTWMDHLLRYSRRDQLSVNLASHRAGARVLKLGGDNRESAWHLWPPLSADRTLRRSSEAPGNAFAHAIRAPLSRLAEIEGPTRDRLDGLEASVRQQEALIAAQRARIGVLEAELVALRGQGERVAARGADGRGVNARTQAGKPASSAQRAWRRTRRSGGRVLRRLGWRR